MGVCTKALNTHKVLTTCKTLSPLGTQLYRCPLNTRLLTVLTITFNLEVIMRNHCHRLELHIILAFLYGTLYKSNFASIRYAPCLA